MSATRTKTEAFAAAAPYLAALVAERRADKNADAAPCVDQPGTGGADPATSEDAA